MKARFYLAMAAAALLMSNCSQDEPLVQSKGATNTLTATIEGASRSAVTDGGAFSWTKGDAIAVGNAEGTFTQFELTDDGTFQAETTIVPTGYAIYPYNEGYTSNAEGTLPTIKMEDEYAYGSTNAPMLAAIAEGENTLQFKHLGGLMRFVVKNVPNSTTSFKFKTNKKITGDFSIETENGENVIKVGDEAETENEVTIQYEIGSLQDQMVFYVPLPTGTYRGYTVTVGDKSHTTQKTVVNTINRGTLLLMPAFTYDATNGLSKDETGIVVLEGTEEVSLTVADEEELIVAVAEGATATLNLTAPEATTDGTVTISDGSEDGTESQTSTAQLNVAAENVSTLNINTPTLTVNLTEGTYGTVEALTAQQTLIIGDGVTIKTLVLKGGNLEVADGASIEEVEVKDEAALRTAIAAGCNVKLAGDITLTEVITIESGTEASINLNGKTLTTSSSTNTPATDDITVVGKLNISNGSISTANTALYVNGGDLTLEGCSITNTTSKYTAVYAAGGTVEAEDVTANVVGTAFLSSGAEMTLTDCNVTKTDGSTTAVTVTKAGTLTISGGEYKSAVNEGSHDESYVIGVKGGSTATINATVTGGNGGVTVLESSTATLTGGSYTGMKACGLYVKQSTVEYSDGCAFSGKENDVAVVESKVNDKEYTEYTAISQDKVTTADQLKNIFTNGGTAVLGDDIDLNVTSNTLTIASGKVVTINLNGKTLTTSSSTNSPATDDITIEGTLNISNGSISTANTALYVNGGELTLENCSITATSKYTAVYAADGTVEAEDVTANVVGTAFLSSGATMTLTDCNVTKTDGSTTAVTVTKAGTLTISGGEYTSQVNANSHDESYVIGVKGGSTATINATVTGGNGGVTVFESSTATLTGGSYTGVKACGLYVAGESTVTYSDDCTFSGVEGDVVVGGGTYGAGTVNGTKYTEYTKIEY